MAHREYGLHPCFIHIFDLLGIALGDPEPWGDIFVLGCECIAGGHEEALEVAMDAGGHEDTDIDVEEEGEDVCLLLFIGVV